MSATEMVEIFICTDCAQLAANGEYPENPDPDQPKPLALIDGWISVGTEENDHDFSRNACHGCGSRLGGYRHQAWIEVPEEVGCKVCGAPAGESHGESQSPEAPFAWSNTCT